VNSTTCDESELGRRNLRNIRTLGVDSVAYSPDPNVRKKMNRLGLSLVGDVAWPEHVGIFTIPVRAAVQFGVPLIIWGENSQNEYGGPAASQSSPFLNRDWLEEFGGLIGLRVSDLPSLISGITDRDLTMYTYPSDEELSSVGVTGLFLGHYFRWDGLSNAVHAQAWGFESYSSVVEGSVVNYENLDNHQHGIHDYLKYLKFGFGRATDIASLHIRRGRMTRNQGLALVRKHDGMYPSSYLGKPLGDILHGFDMTVEEFDGICDKFTTKGLFRSESGELLRRLDGSPVKLNYDN